MTWVWLDKVKIARKRLRGTKWRWRDKRRLKDRGTMAKVKKRVLALSRGTNQAMRSHIVLRIKIFNGSDLKSWIELTYVEMIQVTCSSYIYSKRGDKVNCILDEVILRRSGIWRHWRLKWLNWLYTFDLEFRICRTIKRDANLVGLRKIECSSIKTKSKERHS